MTVHYVVCPESGVRKVFYLYGKFPNSLRNAHQPKRAVEKSGVCHPSCSDPGGGSCLCCKRIGTRERGEGLFYRERAKKVLIRIRRRGILDQVLSPGMTRERSAPPGRFPGEGTLVRSPEECNLFRRIPDACGLTIQSLSKVDASFCLTGARIQPAVHPPPLQ